MEGHASIVPLSDWLWSMGLGGSRRREDEEGRQVYDGRLIGYSFFLADSAYTDD